jgi:glyceraldehyde-3-phosphate dehydrogenase [NAD(P)+]
MSIAIKEKPKIELGDFFKPIYEVDDDGLPKFKIYINGKWIFTEETLEVDTPIDNSVIARVAKAGKREIEAAINAANEKKKQSRDTPVIEKLEIFERARELLLKHKIDVASTIMAELGKPLRAAESEVIATAERLELVMEEVREIAGEYIPGEFVKDTIGKFAIVIREPLGVVAAIAPFNYPLYISAAKIIPALASGNTVVAKPSTDAPITLLLFARILEVAGVREGCLNVVIGGGREIGDLLITDEKINMISFTGSTEVGKRIASLAGMKKRHLELGGKAAAIILEDADLDLAVKKCVEGALKNSGQRCDAISRILVSEKIADLFVARALKEVEEWKIGDPRDKETRIGPLTNEAAVKKVDRLVKDAIAKGARLLLGGKFEKCYYYPTVLDHVPLNADIAWEETFGPVLTIIRVKDLDEAIEVANRSKYGLDSAIFTTNLFHAWRAAKSLEVGEVTINDAPAHGVGNFPFGGIKESGVGREGLGYSIDEMTAIKTIIFNMKK